MKILAWDTSSKSGALVAMERFSDSGTLELVTELILNVDLTHSERLLWGIHHVLEAARWKVEDVDLFGVGVGPGSFTGLRIGVTTARTLAHTLNKPLVGVSSLAALARPLSLQIPADRRSKTWIVAVTDACKGEVFGLWGKASQVCSCVIPPLEGHSDLSTTSTGTSKGSGLWKRGVEERVITPASLVERLLKKLKPSLASSEFESYVMVGEGKARYLETWEALPGFDRLEEGVSWAHTIQGRYLGMLVDEAWQAGFYQQALQVTPRYLRGSEAERKLKAGLLRPAVSVR